jgi:hypothetical protein
MPSCRDFGYPLNVRELQQPSENGMTQAMLIATRRPPARMGWRRRCAIGRHSADVL